VTAVPTALLLLRGRTDDVRSWARRGLLPVWIVPGVTWTLVVPAGDPVAAPPYDDPVALLGGRPVPGRLRPSLVVVADGPRAVVAVHDAPRRAVQRWLVWGEGTGLTRIDGLPHAPVGLLAEAAAARGHAARGRLDDALATDDRRAATRSRTTTSPPTPRMPSMQAANAPTPGTTRPPHSRASAASAVTTTSAPTRARARSAERRLPEP
jgi:hypothetical protein